MIQRVLESPNRPATGPLVVSFFTVDTLYENEVKYLIPTLKKYRVPYWVIGVKADPGSSWENICQLKPHVLQMACKQNPGNDIVWLDADSSVVSRPDFFWDFRRTCSTADIFVHCKDRAKGAYMSGTIVLPAGGMRDALISRWISEQDGHPSKWDQVAMSDTIKHFKVGTLPPNYIKKFDQSGTPVVVHWMASREWAHPNSKTKTRPPEDRMARFKS